MARLIDADKIVNGIALYMAENAYLNDTPLDALKMVANWITEAPPVDAVEVVRCRDCILHGNCYMEDAFSFANVPNPFCVAGKLNDASARAAEGGTRE